MTTFMNNVKTAVLLGALFALLVGVGSIWGVTGMVIAGVLAIVLNFGAWFFSDRIAVTAMRGRQATAENAPELVNMVSRLADRAGLPMPKVYVCPQDAPNAFATGRSPSRAAVAVTQGAMRLQDRAELEGVLGHELAHIRNRDTLTSAIAATVAGLFSVLAQMSFWMMLGGNRQGGNPLVLIGAVLLGAIGAGLIKAMISRSREFVADAQGAQIAGSPHGLVSALRKLEAVSRQVPMKNPNPAMNGMFIVEPFVGKTMTKLFATHPPTEQRIAALLKNA